jgi:hypothetical protein
LSNLLEMSKVKSFWTGKLKTVLQNEQGQMAIFVALIFQVLFVFFAMVINIGLIIHDKINLQNSVDIAAYYAAERQSEILNEIAHINYQIHQDNKLLAWRYRVLGTLGRPASPAFQFSQNPVPTPLTDVPYAEAGMDPSICVGHTGWAELHIADPSKAGNNLCDHDESTRIPPIPRATIIPGAIQPFPNIAGFTDQIRAQYKQSCEDGGAIDWYFTGLILQAYREAIANRKAMIRTLSRNLSSSKTDFMDQSMNSVAQTAERTFTKNLTLTNSSNAPKFEFLNSLGLAQCAGAGESGVASWLSDIAIRPVLLYRDMIDNGGCERTIRPHTDPTRSPSYLKFDPAGILRTVLTQEYPLTDLHRASRGFEKNPWCLAYVGVKASVSSIKPFAPLGNPITLTARAFAQPFGGRIGPWDRSSWPVGSDHSVGAIKDGEIDPIAVIRSAPGGADQVDPTQPGPENRERFLPNYSRYPGDVLGLKSQIAMGNARQKLAQIYNPALNQQIAFKWYSSFNTIPQTGDVLAYDAANPANYVRSIEAAVIAPDLFDITYYSIEPHYFDNYSTYDMAPLPNGQRRFAPGTVISDLGSHLGDPRTQGFSVYDQIGLVSPVNTIEVAPTFYAVTDQSQLLTGWTQNSPTSYAFPTESFGQCAPGQTPDIQRGQPRIPGNCADGERGGRVGYSVRLISKDFLRATDLELGGAGIKGPIVNPPGDF